MAKSDDGKPALSCAAVSEDALGKLRLTLERYSQTKPAALVITGDPNEPKTWTALSVMLAEDGFISEEIPASDYEINFQFDVTNGSGVGTHAAKHDLVDQNSSIGRSVVKAIARSFVKAVEDLAVEVDALLDQNNIDGAIEAIKRGADRGAFSLSPSRRLLDALRRIDVKRLSQEDRRLIRDACLGTAQRLGRSDIASTEASALLSEDASTLSAEQTASLKMVVAIDLIKTGSRETGLAMLRDLLKSPSALGPEGRGWAWRNISLALGPDEPEARRANQLSADAFLEAGNKHEAGKSLMGLVNILMNEDPSEAVTRLDEIVALTAKDGLLDRRVRSAALHARANRLARLNRHAEAFRDASEAVETARGLIGIEAEFVSSLHLAAIEAHRTGNHAGAEKFEAEAEKLTDELKLPHFQLARGVRALAQKFDKAKAEALLQEAETANNLDVIVSVRVLQATADPTINDTDRLRLLEETRNRAARSSARGGILKPIDMAIGQQLALMGKPERATAWFHKVLEADAFDTFARNGLIECLWQTEQWGDAAVFIRKQMCLCGDLPGLTYALGKSLFEAGDLSGAVAALTKVLAIATFDANLRRNADELRERALEMGGTVLAAAPPAPPTGAVTRQELEAALNDFARFIAAEKRMRFWTSDKSGGHRWVPSPEGRAQDLLHTFLKARFNERIEIFEEISTGAGRLDLYVKMEGGLSVIVELKMCGGSYSSNYAASGEDQIHHYMDNRKSNLGYLIVFDGRIDLNGQPLLTQAGEKRTVVEKLINVSPRVIPLSKSIA